MGEVTGIAWTDSTFNAWIGCQRVSEGCVHCYAEALDARKRWGGVTHWGPTAPRRRTAASTWAKPITWNAKAKKLGVRPRVFCSSLADVFEDRAEIVPWRQDLFDLIRKTPQLDWLLLTKRPENIQRLWPVLSLGWGARFWPNVWLGTTVENAKRAVDRIDVLSSIDAAVRFLSIEPLIEHPGTLDLRRIDWAIIGGESGPGARPFNIGWARDLVRQARAVGTAPFVKQLGAHTISDGLGMYGPGERLHTVDPAGSDPLEWPLDLRVREFPKARSS